MSHSAYALFDANYSALLLLVPLLPLSMYHFIQANVYVDRMFTLNIYHRTAAVSQHLNFYVACYYTLQ